VVYRASLLRKWGSRPRRFESSLLRQVKLAQDSMFCASFVYYVIMIMSTISTWIVNRVPAFLVSWSFRKIFGRRDLLVFGRLLELPKWKKVSYDNPEKWIFEDDNSFVIEVSSESRDFAEAWTNRFPDKGSAAVEVLLKINGERVHTPLLFVGVDGWRYFVPCPKRAEAYEKQYYYWDTDSIEYKVFGVIGRVDYLFDSLEKFGEACDVKIK
jgi:hypothetical protein